MFKNYLTCFSLGVTVMLWARSVEVVNSCVMYVAGEVTAADVKTVLPRAASCPESYTSPELQLGSPSTHCVTGQGFTVTFCDASLYSPFLLNLN